jgi:hypothetical protein
MKLQHLTRLVEIYGKWESQTNASTSTSEKIGRIQRRTLQMTSKKEIQRDLEIKEDADQIIQYLTHSLEIYGWWESRTKQAQALARRLDKY